MIKTIDAKKCNGCYACVECCMTDVLRFDEATKKAYIEYLDDCQTCFLCELFCPTGAVYVNPFTRPNQVGPWNENGRSL